MIGTEIRNKRKELGLTQKELAIILGVSHNTISNWEKGEVIPASKENMLREFINNNIVNNEVVAKKENTPTPGVPYYEDIEATASITSSFSDFKEVPTFYINYEHFNDCTAYVPIFGDSMYPAFCSGEIIAIKQVFNLDVIFWGEAYFVVTNSNANDIRAAKLLFQHEDESKVILRSSNPNYKGDTVINKKDILRLFVIKGKIQRKHL
ncbi:helix-turn-helix domain-containing protein [Flavobacterium agricola]|uniref:Helix-turn-helix domain-containing protein n=1 Tax=Flavobacterium agricola TaxID=2870839 RepID=A0ABY6M3K5_9FLAO|nr:helix-turn-helix domain-containing protein [Flavobacterium agricola]UYW02080.1 helix-turn-helix domain-containing protein [Flavobacterium agricola]